MGGKGGTKTNNMTNRNTMSGRARQEGLKLWEHSLKLHRGKETLDTEEQGGTNTSLHSLSQKVSKRTLRHKLVGPGWVLSGSIDPGVSSEVARVGGLVGQNS